MTIGSQVGFCSGTALSEPSTEASDLGRFQTFSLLSLKSFLCERPLCLPPLPIFRSFRRRKQKSSISAAGFENFTGTDEVRVVSMSSGLLMGSRVLVNGP